MEHAEAVDPAAAAKFNCLICTGWPTEPVETRCCGIFMCAECERRNRAGPAPPRCPQCRVSYKTNAVHKSPNLTREIGATEVSCLCCGRTTRSADFEEHIAKECIEVVLPCPNAKNGCSFQGKRAALATHLAEECAHGYREVDAEAVRLCGGEDQLVDNERFIERMLAAGPESGGSPLPPRRLREELRDGGRFLVAAVYQRLVEDGGQRPLGRIRRAMKLNVDPDLAAGLLEDYRSTLAAFVVDDWNLHSGESRLPPAALKSRGVERPRIWELPGRGLSTCEATFRPCFACHPSLPEAQWLPPDAHGWFVDANWWEGAQTAWPGGSDRSSGDVESVAASRSGRRRYGVASDYLPQYYFSAGWRGISDSLVSREVRERLDGPQGLPAVSAEAGAAGRGGEGGEEHPDPRGVTDARISSTRAAPAAAVGNPLPASTASDSPTLRLPNHRVGASSGSTGVAVTGKGGNRAGPGEENNDHAKGGGGGGKGASMIRILRDDTFAGNANKGHAKGGFIGAMYTRVSSNVGAGNGDDGPTKGGSSSKGVAANRPASMLAVASSDNTSEGKGNASDNIGEGKGNASSSTFKGKGKSGKGKGKSVINSIIKGKMGSILRSKGKG
eukprot:gene206-200_t